MPRISEKFKIACHLKDLWLSNTIMDNVFDNSNEILLLLKYLGPHSQSSREFLQLPSAQTAIDVRQFLIILDEPEISSILIGEGPEACLESEESGLGKEIEEIIEFLGLSIPAIRYLMPREPIPRSDYMFQHHVGYQILLA